MNRFTFEQPHTVTDALRQMDPDNGTRFIAGGTNLIDLMRADVERPDHLIDINRLDLHDITEMPGGGLRLGALAKNADTAYHERVQHHPLQ